MQLSSTAQAAGKASVRSCAPRLTRTTNAPGRRASQQARPIFGGAPLKSVFSSGRTQQVATIAEQVTTDAVVAPAAPAAEPYLGKKAVIVGAGPAGSTAAMYLARQGFSVEVYERRPEPKADAVDTGRAYIIILIPRGQAALERLGVKLETSDEFRTRGTVRHSKDGKVSVSKEDSNVTFSRSDLAQRLIDEAKRRYPGRINYHFGAAFDSYDAATNSATFTVAGSDGGPSHSEVCAYDLMVGADGAASAVRSALQRRLGDSFAVNIDDSGREYKVYTNLPGDIEPAEFKGKTGTTLHIFASKAGPMTTLTAHSNPDGTYTGTFALRTGSFDNFKSAADYESFIRANFVGVPEDWVPQIAAQVAAAPANSQGKRVKCSQLHDGRLLILGDAAHGVTPVFGQGANSALESCLVLDQVLAGAKGDCAAVPAAFTDARRDDAHALYEIDRKAFSFFSGRGLLDPDFRQLMSHVALGFLLSKIVPFLYGPKPAIMKLGSNTRYSEILASVNRDSAVAALLALAGVVFAACKFFKVL